MPVLASAPLYTRPRRSQLTPSPPPSPSLQLRVPKEIADELAELRAYKTRTAAAAGLPPAMPPPAMRSGFAPTTSV